MVISMLASMIAIQAAYLNETAMWQEMIDASSAAGGGCVIVPAGVHSVAELELKSNVTLELAEGARLVAINDYSLYRWKKGLKAELQRTGVLVAYGATNIAVVGKGTIDGGGDREPKTTERPTRWRNIYFEDCRDVTIRDVKMENPSFWTCFLRRCDGVLVKGVTIRSLSNYNNDGLDLCVSNALIEDCDIVSEDDSIVMKNFDADWVSENVEIRNCRVSSNASYIKFGTETHGILRDFHIHDCEIVARAASFWRKNAGRPEWPGLTDPRHGTGGLVFLMVDGGVLENVRVHDITMHKGVCVPLVFRLGRRRGRENWNRTAMRNITLERIRMEDAALCGVGNFISGVPGLDIDGVTIRDSSFKMQALPDAPDWGGLSLAENEAANPGAGIFESPMPASFLYVRHARNVVLERVVVEMDVEDESRPHVVSDALDVVIVRDCAFGSVERAVALPVSASARLQDDIDAAAARGGGRIVVPSGIHEAKPFVLKDNVTLELAEGAVLLASTNIADYAAKEGERCFIYAVNATNVSIVGKGTIAGRGWAFKERKGLAGESQPQALPVMMRFSCCRGVRLEDFTYRDCGAWGCHLRNCDGVTMRRVKCFSHANNTNDGIDVESSNVLIEDCDIDSDDDALVFKTESDKTFPVTNVVVRNCRLASCCNALKFGTGSYCDFRDILVEGCRFERPKGNFRFDWKKTYADRGVKEDLTGLGGVALEVVDGGCMENVTIRNIDLAGYIVPIFVRLARRNEPADARGSYLRNVLIENVKGACATSRNGCSITGLPDLRPSGITLRNVSLTFPGGGTAAERDLGVPEMERAYPEGVMFGRNLPAWAFYLRHADNVTFDNVKFSLEGDDEREMIVKEDCN